MWRDVFLHNQEAVLEMLGRLNEDIALLARAIRWGEGDKLFDLFTRTRAIRRGIISSRKPAPFARAKAKMSRSAAPGPSVATSRVLCAVWPRLSAAVTKLFPQHSSIRRYMPGRAELASRGTATFRRDPVERGGCLDLVAG